MSDQPEPKYPTPEQVRTQIHVHEAEALQRLRDTIRVRLYAMVLPIARVAVPHGLRTEDLDVVVAELKALGWCAESALRQQGSHVSEEHPALLLISLPPEPASEGANQ